MGHCDHIRRAQSSPETRPPLYFVAHSESHLELAAFNPARLEPALRATTVPNVAELLAGAIRFSTASC